MLSKPYAGISCSLFLVLSHICFSLYQIWPQVHTVDTPEQVCVCVCTCLCVGIYVYIQACVCVFSVIEEIVKKIVCVN